jgi:hypothetical protein
MDCPAAIAEVCGGTTEKNCGKCIQTNFFALRSRCSEELLFTACLSMPPPSKHPPQIITVADNNFAFRFQSSCHARLYWICSAGSNVYGANKSVLIALKRTASC